LKTYPQECDCFFEVFEPADDDHEIISLINKYRKP